MRRVSCQAMRHAARLGHLLATVLWISAGGCVPQQELSGYSAGVEASGAPALESAAAPEEGAAPAAEPAPDVPAGPAGTPSDTPANTDGPAQPEQLAPSEPAAAAGTMATDAPPPGSEPAEAPAPPPGEAPPTTTDATAPAEPGTTPDPLVTDVPPVPGQFRFVRLIADSEFSGGPLTAAAELEVLGADGQAFDRAGWIATADSAEPAFFGGAPAALAIDGQPTSIWHTAWFQLAEPPPHPHFLQLDMGQPRSVTGFRYLARQDASVGRIADYRFFVSNDGVEWGEPVLAGRLEDTALPQDVRITEP